MDAGNYEDFLRSTLRGIAVGCGLTYEQLTGDLTKVNFSSIRAGLIEFRRSMEARQSRLLVFQFCRPTWVRVLQVAMLSGRISIPEADMRRASRPDWIGTPGFEYVDPEKEVKADVRAVRSGFKSRSQIVAKGGKRRARLDEEIERERKDAESKDLVFDSDPKAVAELEADGEQAGEFGNAGESGEA
jgi:lambda family phage portal protein